MFEDDSLADREDRKLSLHSSAYLQTQKNILIITMPTHEIFEFT